ncbi:MAG: WbqC family protein [Pseudomonadota bacterium]
MTTLAIMQPTYLPWLGYFDLIRRADVFVLLDHVQFSRQSWQQRNRIRNGDGEIVLTVPVSRQSVTATSVAAAKIDHSRRPFLKHARSIAQNYANSKNREWLMDDLIALYDTAVDSLADFNQRLIAFGCERMNIDTTMLRSSDLNITSTRVGGVLEICRATKATTYLSTPGAERYLDETALAQFAKSGIEFSYHRFEHPTYAQCNYPDFISHLAFIDYLFNAETACKQ